MGQIFEEGLKLVVTVGISEYIKKINDIYIKPKLENKYKKTQSKNNLYLIEEKFKEYMERAYNNNLYMSTIVFKNQQKIINDLYIPLTVSKCCSETNKEKIEVLIDGYKDDFIPLHKKILLVDNAGMGKSTILKYLYVSAIIESKGIPILIELRKLDKGIAIIDFIMNELNGIKEYFNKEDILDLIEGGGFIFFFDGYDEVTEDYKKRITENLQEFISKTSNSKDLENSFVISSRDENSLSCFSDFQRFDIESLTKKEAYQLISKYDNDGELSKELIENLEGEENLKIISEFLTTPLMISLLYKAFEYKRVVPYKKQIFYRQVYDALFEDHDRTKGGAYVHAKRSKLDIEDFHRVLRALGFVTLSKGISYCKEELIEKLTYSKRITGGIQFKENDFIYDIVHSVPLFIKEGIEYRWAHKSFQEYFAASYICFDSKEKQSQYLSSMVADGKIYRYYNVLDFCYDIDYKEFRKTLIYPLIVKFIKYYDGAYKSNKYSDLDKANINIIKNINFIYDEIYLKVNKAMDFNMVDNSQPHGRLKLAFKNWDKFEQRGSRLGVYQFDDIEILFGFTSEYVYIMMKLFISKKLSIVKEVSYKRNKYNSKDILKYLGHKEYILNKNNEDILNEKKMFESIKNFLIDSMPDKRRTKKYLFDYDECVNLRDEIHKDINAEEDIFL